MWRKLFFITMMSLFILHTKLIVHAEGSFSVRTFENFTVVSEPSENASILYVGTMEETFSAMDVIDNYFVIDYQGATAYISRELATPIFQQSIMNIQIVDESSPVFIKQGDAMKQIGTLKKGAILQRFYEIEGFHVVAVYGVNYYLTIDGTIPTEQAEPNDNLPKAKFPMQLISEVDAPLMNRNGEQVATINGGMKVDLLAVEGNLGVIAFLGKERLIYLTDFTHQDLLYPKKKLSYEETNYILKLVYALYPEFTKLEMIGKSVEGREIYALKIGTGSKEILLDGSLHAREHMTTNVLVEMIDTYSMHFVRGSSFSNLPVQSILNNTSIWFVPMMNPDGVTLVQSGPKSLKNGPLVSKINGKNSFDRWKANGRGVDLNENFDAQWSKIKSSVKYPAYQKYKGAKVFSEPESKALKSFILKHKFLTYGSYHSAGEVIYWYQYQTGARKNRDLALAKNVAKITGYSVVPPLNIVGSGSSVDWFMDVTKQPGLTIEISRYYGQKPVPLSEWDRIWKQNKTVGIYLAQQASKR